MQTSYPDEHNCGKRAEHHIAALSPPTAFQTALGAGERLVDDLIHVEILIGTAPADEFHMWFGVSQLPVFLVKRW